MKNDLTCGVVRDLLPSYVEELLCEESRQAVDRHLADCPDCTGALSAMRGPEEQGIPEEQTADVDYLKKVKKRNRWKIIAAAVCAVLVVVAAFLYQTFERGTPVDPQMIGIWELSVIEKGDRTYLHLSMGTPSSAIAFHGWRVATGTGEGIEIGEVGYITAQKVLVSPLHRDGGVTLDVPLSGNRKEMWLGSPSGRLLWQDGVVISQTALDLLDTKAPYCGDPAVLERIADILHLSDRLGSYTVSLQTAQPPYGWTVQCANPLNDEQRKIAACFNILALALVDNLESSQCTYPSADLEAIKAEINSSFSELTALSLVTEYNASHGTDWKVKDSVKDYASSPADLQRLLLMLDSFYGTNLATP